MYRSKSIDISNISEYSGVIPEKYHKQIRLGDLRCGEISGPEGDMEHAAMLYVISCRAGWMEIVWLEFPDREKSDPYYAGLVRSMIQNERYRWGKPLKGVYSEFYPYGKFRPERILDVLTLAGMESYITKSCLYEFSIRDVTGTELLLKAAKRMKFVRLLDADLKILDKLDEMMLDDTRPLPLPPFVNWDIYMQEESLISMNEESPSGFLLLSQHEDAFVIDCAYVTDKTILAGLLGSAYASIKEKYGEEQKILVPVVVDRTAAIVERLVPNAEREDVMEAVLYL